MRKTKQMANQIKEPADVWELELCLNERRKEIDRKYDYRYSQLTQVFGRLLYERRVTEEDLRGLGEDKMKPIRSLAELLAEVRGLNWILGCDPSWRNSPQHSKPQ